MSKEQQDSKSDNLRDAILANLKHAYFNAKTDTIALENGLIPNHNHALGILENKTYEQAELGCLKKLIELTNH